MKSKHSKYEMLKDGVIERYDRDVILRFACCDCGLVHDYEIAQTKKYMYFRATRKPKHTAQLRRYHYGKLNQCGNK
jgi:hypothetical protein